MPTDWPVRSETITSKLQAPSNSRTLTQKAKAPISSRNPAPGRHRRVRGCRAQARQQDSRPSAVQDAQDTELATADQQAKQDLYAQLLDRQKSSSPSEVSTSRDVGKQSATPGSGQPDKGSTELIFRLERRGEGWGEEIFPHLVVEQRPWITTAKRDRNRSTRPKPWTAKTLPTTPSLLRHSPPAVASLTTRPAPRHAPRNVCTAALSSSSPDEPAEHAVHAGQQEGSAEQFLLNECGIEESKVDGIITAAVAWRVTPGGRQLIDRRRRSRIERNMLQCAEYLIKECGIEPGSKGVGQIFAKVPQIMLCKPSTNDRWDRRVVQLAAFMHFHGHCNVPEGWTEAPDLAKWVRRQRVARAQSALSEERLQVLYAMGFEFGEVAQLTGEWEAKFDQLIEWLLWQDQDDARKQGFNWLGFDWGRKGGLQARELALWVQLQREFRRRNLLGTDAIKRLEAIGFRWEPEPGGKMWQHKWMHQLGKLLYIVERNRKISAAVASQPSRPHNRQTDQSSLPPQREGQSVPRSAPTGSRDLSMDIVTQRPVLRASGQSVSRGFPPPYPSRYSPQGSRVGPQGGQKQAVSKGANALQRQIAKRRAALASAHLEAGQGFWLAKQRWLWRRGRLSREQFLMLQLAGLEMDIDPPLQWKRLAHETAHYLHGSQIHPDQEARDSGAVPERQALGAAGAAKQPAGLLLPRAKGRPRKLAHQPEGQPTHQQQQAIQAQYGHQQALPAQAATWQSDMNPPQLYAMAHNSARAVGGPSSMLVQQPQLQFRQLLSRPATASTRVSSGANLGASSASLDEEEYPNSASQQQQQQQHSAGVQSTAQGSTATAVAASSGGGSLYACTPPGRPPGRRLAVVRWVLNQRALWREGQLTPVQIQYMTILGMTWLLSSKVVQMAEAAWLEQLQAFGQQVAAVGQQAAAQHGRITDWFLHQQGLFALGFLQPRRVQKLDEIGVSWQPHRTDADILWDARLTQLLSFRREHGHVQVLPGSTNDQNLSSWLGFQCKLLKKGMLSSARAAQLLALGVKPDDQTLS